MSDKVEQVERLVAELKATGTLWPETVADLERYVEEARAGTLWEDDYTYLVALHAKVVNGETPDGQPVEPELSADEWKARAERAERMFHEIRRRFDSHYHPDNVAADAPDAALRAEVYRTFSGEFDAVERE